MSSSETQVSFDQRLSEAEATLGDNSQLGFTKTLELIEAYELAADIAPVSKAKELLARCYQAHGNYNKALKVCLEALHYFESIQDYAWAAKCLNTLGAVYNYLGEFDNRLQTNLTCLSYRRKGDDEQGEISTLSNIGDSYNSMGQHEKALEYFNLCLEFSSITDRTKTIVVHNIGETEFYKGNFDIAGDYFRQAIDLARNTSYYIIEEVALVFLSKIYMLANNFSEAEKHLEQAKLIVEEKKYRTELPVIFELLAKCADGQNDHARALAYYKNFIELSDQIRKENDTRAIQDMQFSYRVDKLQEENKIHKEKNKALRQAYLKIAQQHREIEEKNRAITDSINYALKIQSSLLPSPWRFKKAFPESFIYNQPRDIVSGDFYWLHETDERITMALADCTGHGVPGALMSIVGINCLNIVISDTKATDPGAILTLLDEKIVSALNMGSGVTNSADGMDISLLQINKKNGSVSIASANRPVFLVTKGELVEIKPDKFPIGEYYLNGKTFTTHRLDASKGDQIYLFTDGYSDQFGGDRGKKLKLNAFSEFIRSISHHTMDEQNNLVREFFINWMGRHEQLDDVCLVGLQLV